MDAAAAAEVADAVSGMAIENEDSGENGTQPNGKLGDPAQSREGDMINGDASHSQGGKPRASKGSHTQSSKLAKPQGRSTRISGDEARAKKSAPISGSSNASSSLPKPPIARVSYPDSIDGSPTNSDTGVGRNQVEKKDFRPAATETSPLEDSKEKKKNQKPLNQHSSNKDEEEMQGTKPRKVGSTPSYGFTFKCDERAEKRKEFYTKLEEKIHAKELEKSTLQAKTKETEEAELKLLRKRLSFKATPMPSFYQEPPPPKVELKKIPPTRAKSPKLGRTKNTSATDIEENSNRSSRPARLSLDEKTSANGVTKATHVNSKRPQRKSLPKLPSDKTASLDAAGSPLPVEQVENTGSNMDPVQEPIRAEVTPDEHEVREEKAIEQEPDDLVF